MKKNTILELHTHLTEQSPMGILVTDKNGTIAFANQTLNGMLNSRQDQWLGKPLTQVLGEKLQRFSNKPDVWSLSTGAPANDRWFITVLAELPEGQTAYYFVDTTEIMRLRTQVRNLSDQLEHSVTKDVMTGVLNKRATMQALDHQVSRSRRYQNPLSLVVLAVDGCDTASAGYSPTTDQVLKAVSFYLRDQMRWVDLVGRTGDKEFTVVLPETKEDDAQKLVNKLVERLHNLSVPETPDITVMVNARFGMASWRRGDDVTTLLQRAQPGTETTAVAAG